MLGSPYHLTGEPEKTAAMVRETIARSSGAQTFPRAMLTVALANGGQFDEAMAVPKTCPSAEAIDNPQLKALVLMAYTWAYSNADPAAAYAIGRRAMKIAHDTGNRYVESTISVGMSG